MQLLTTGNWFQRVAGLHFNYPMASEMCHEFLVAYWYFGKIQKIFFFATFEAPGWHK